MKAKRDADTNEWHASAKGFLEAAIDQAALERVPCIVMTHHLPSYRLIHPRYAGSPLNFSFATSLDTVVAAPHVVQVICGHSHSFMHVKLGKTTWAVLNPAGYPHEHGLDDALSDAQCIVKVNIPTLVQNLRVT